jgi:DNA-binding response OmpR family regulator
MRRLLVFAPETLGRRLGAELGRSGYSVTLAFSESEIATGADAVLLSAGDSLEELCRRFKANRIPTLVLLTHVSLGTAGTLSCDDFAVEPFEAQELAARLARLLKAKGAAQAERLSLRGLVIDSSEARVYIDGEPVDLTFREYELLRYLAEHPGRVFSRDALLNAVWGYDYFGGDRTVDVHIRRLRSKIEDPDHSYIDTVRNIGYRFKKGAA